MFLPDFDITLQMSPKPVIFQTAAKKPNPCARQLQRCIQILEQTSWLVYIIKPFAFLIWNHCMLIGLIASILIRMQSHLWWITFSKLTA